MCGIAGIVSSHGFDPERLRLAERVQAHRGPDAAAIKSLQIGRFCVGLGHQRLAILDLSEAGNQPMMEADESGWIVFNGEIYNFIEIRADLEALGRQFRSTSDTEVILAALRTWGPEEALRRFNGMWAFAWLDIKGRRLVLSRDRTGVKPLYLHHGQGELLFSSEIKGILAMSQRRFGLNAQVIGEFLNQSLLDTGIETFFEGITKLPAGHYATLDLEAPTLAPQYHRYWTLPEEVAEDRPESELIEEFRSLLLDAVRLRLRSDVPLGVLLSGGLDSSSIAAAMRALCGQDAQLHLISAVNNDARYDESPFIDIMARHLSCPVAKVPIDFQPEEAFGLLEKVCWHNDEPVGSFSNVAHYLLMKEAKGLGITVILSGQGADEILCGYKKYLGFYAQQLIREGHPGQAIGLLAGFLRQGTILNQFSFGEAKRYLPRFMVPMATPSILGPALLDTRPVAMAMQGCRTVNQRQKLDVEKFSVPIINHYEDRMSMAWSREIRVPFLDFRLVERMVSLPMRHKLSKGWTKSIMRKAMSSVLPPEIAWRKDKQGFVTPQAEWFKQRLVEKTRERFSPESLMARYGLVDMARLNQAYTAYCGQGPNQRGISYKEIFNPLSLETWLRQFQDHISA